MKPIPVKINKSDLGPYILFNHSPKMYEASRKWARQPENQTGEHLTKCALYHPGVREVYLELGLIEIVEDDK